jgi:hypothetical protein
MVLIEEAAGSKVLTAQCACSTCFRPAANFSSIIHVRTDAHRGLPHGGRTKGERVTEAET